MRSKKTSRKKTKTKIGSSWLLVVAAVVLAAAPAFPAKRAKPVEPFATVAGTVFRVPGFALAGAEVSVEPETTERNGVKFKKAQTVTNFRGEWAVRVPPVPMSYTVHVKVNGYESQQKIAKIEGEQREELNFLLEPKSGTAGTLEEKK